MSAVRSLTVLLLAAAAAPLTAQTVEDGARLLARGDTAGALAAYEALLKRDRRNAEAHYRLGRLLLARVDPEAAVSADRRNAETHLRYATRFAPDSARYWLALADKFRAEDVVTVRVQVAGLVDRARKAAAAAEDDSAVTEAEYRAARIAWERHEQFGYRFAAAETGKRPIFPDPLAEWNEWEDFVDHAVRRVPGDADDLDAAEGALWRALARRPADVRCAGLLVVLLGETDRWAEAMALARRLAALAPDSGRAWTLLGLTYARTERWRDATAAFDTALARMTPAERAPYGDLGQIMRRADRIRWAQMPEDDRERLDSLYWRVAQPLLLRETNEVKAEFFARLAYVDHRWSDPWRGYRGYETDIGTVFVRFGPPDLWMVLNRSLIAWVYRPTRFRFTFTLQPGFARAHFAGESREALRLAQEAAPARFDNVPVFATLDTIAVQVAQFRGERDSTAIAVFGAIPLPRMLAAVPLRNPTLETGAVVTDDRGTELQQDRRDEVVRGRDTVGVVHRSWRLTLPPGGYLLRVEAHVPAATRGARSAAPLAVRGYPRDRLSVSDVLAAERVVPRDSAATRWTDFFIEPSGGRFAPGAPVGLLWEIYNLQPDSLGFARYTVELRFTVEAIERRTFLARIVGGIGDATGLSALGDDRIALRWDREVRVTPERANTEHVTVDLRDAPQGRYGIEVVVTDHRTGASAARERVIHVDDEPATRGPAPSSFR
ncbi:MAG: GWxTD domain-containing protein [Gemmatimonadota bacterium]|nr:GWxTD domain-containing protein [Gemmatimonadota bacterium]